MPVTSVQPRDDYSTGVLGSKAVDAVAGCPAKKGEHELVYIRYEEVRRIQRPRFAHRSSDVKPITFIALIVISVLA